MAYHCKIRDQNFFLTLIIFMDISCKTMNIRLVADANFTEKQLKIYVLKTEFHLVNLKY